jgi:hypothetical protein
MMLNSRGRYEREAVERFWALEKGTKRDPLTNTPLAKGERTLFTNWHVRREVAGFLERHPNLTPSDWPDRLVPPPQPTTSVSNATEEVRTARERRRRRDDRDEVLRRRAAVEAGHHQLQSFLILASLLSVNVVVCVLSRRITSSGATLVGHPFSSLVHSHSSGPATPSMPTSAMAPAPLLPAVCDAFLREDAEHSTGSSAGAASGASLKWLLPLPDSGELGTSDRGAGVPVQYGSDRRLRLSYSRFGPKQYCLSPRRCTIHEDHNPRLRISIAARYADWTTCVLFTCTFLWVAASTVWTSWSISVYWRWIPHRWRGDGEDLLLLPTAAFSVLFTAPFWAISATLLLQCAVASLAHTEMELSHTSWSLVSTMPGGWELERAVGDVDDIVGLRAVETALWMPWPLNSASADRTTLVGGGLQGDLGLGTMWRHAQQALLGSTAMEFSHSVIGRSSRSATFRSAPVGPHRDVHNPGSGTDGAARSDGTTGPGSADSTTSSIGDSQIPASASESESVDEDVERRQRARLTRHYEFAHGLSESGTTDLINAALKYLCRQESV